MWGADICSLANSLERVQQYLSIEQEPKATSEGIPPAYWPSSGDLVVDSLSAKYSSVSGNFDLQGYEILNVLSQNGPDVLRNISFKIKAGERVGIGTCPRLQMRYDY